MEADPLLDCREMVAGYAGPVIGPVSFTLDSGEVMGLHGCNGAGKSTILGAIAGAVRVFSGEIRRRPGLKVAHHRQRPIRPAELPLTGKELLRLTGASQAGAPAPLPGLLPLRLDRLSGGQFQLLHIWACLGSAAELVMLDEPTNNLDPAALVVLKQMLQQNHAGRAVLVVSHEAGFLDEICSRVLHLRCE